MQGDVTDIYTSAGLKVASYAYDAWEKVISVNNYTAENIGDLNPIRYRGYYYDVETGLYYLNSRYYDPETGAVQGAVEGYQETGTLDGTLRGIGRGAVKGAVQGAADGLISGMVSGAFAGAMNPSFCFVAGTTVLTTLGKKAIENI